jgi:imidazoleglycerol-phosphate dehydratase
MARSATITRKTKETNISLTLGIDGKGISDIKSGNGFFDHMLTLMAHHASMDLSLYCDGDIEIDFHHSAEDIGICIGQAIAQALGDCRGINRYATAFIPMDEALARVCIDICGRPNLSYKSDPADRIIGDFDVDLTQDFFKALCDHAKLTLHIDVLRGRNAHHIVEAIFKGFGRAMREATTYDPRHENDIPSSKGTL